MPPFAAHPDPPFAGNGSAARGDDDAAARDDEDDDYNILKSFDNLVAKFHIPQKHFFLSICNSEVLVLQV